MKPDEQVVAVINHRENILVFGSLGSVIKMSINLSGQPTFVGWELPRLNAASSSSGPARR